MQIWTLVCRSSLRGEVVPEIFFRHARDLEQVNLSIFLRYKCGFQMPSISPVQLKTKAFMANFAILGIVHDSCLIVNYPNHLHVTGAEFHSAEKVQISTLRLMVVMWLRLSVIVLTNGPLHGKLGFTARGCTIISTHVLIRLMPWLRSKTRDGDYLEDQL